MGDDMGKITIILGAAVFLLPLMLPQAKAETIQFDFALPGCIPLKNNKIAVAGYVPWSNKSRRIVMIKDIETEEEKIIDSYFVDYNLSHIEFSNGKKYYQYF